MQKRPNSAISSTLGKGSTQKQCVHFLETAVFVLKDSLQSTKSV